MKVTGGKKAVSVGFGLQHGSAIWLMETFQGLMEILLAFFHSSLQPSSTYKNLSWGKRIPLPSPVFAKSVWVNVKSNSTRSPLLAALVESPCLGVTKLSSDIEGKMGEGGQISATGRTLNDILCPAAFLVYICKIPEAASPGCVHSQILTAMFPF